MAVRYHRSVCDVVLIQQGLVVDHQDHLILEHLHRPVPRVGQARKIRQTLTHGVTNQQGFKCLGWSVGGQQRRFRQKRIVVGRGAQGLGPAGDRTVQGIVRTQVDRPIHTQFKQQPGRQVSQPLDVTEAWSHKP